MAESRLLDCPVFVLLLQRRVKPSDCRRYRARCESIILHDFDFALKKSVENRLWDAHLRLNNRFRKQLSFVGPSDPHPAMKADYFATIVSGVRGEEETG